MTTHIPIRIHIYLASGDRLQHHARTCSSSCFYTRGKLTQIPFYGAAMLFSEPVFLFIFLPSLLAFYYASPISWRNAVLLFCSLFFYAWGEPFYVFLMLALVAVNYGAATIIGSAHHLLLRRLALLFAIIADVASLAIFKYAGFVSESAAHLLGFLGLPRVPTVSLALPIGISFYTFQAMSYVIDVYAGRAPVQKRFLDLALYIALFPQLIAGPIVRYTCIMEQLGRRSHAVSLFASGIRRFTIGLAKKLLIADVLGRITDPIFASASSGLAPGVAWFGVLAYGGQIYFDFSGYSDMAIGLGRMFGFRFEENFNYPYVSRSITEFWRRWHISLSTWFRDYLYIPLGGNRRGPIHTYRNLILVFFICGLWHGAAWTFVLWGLYHGLFLIIERVGLRRVLDSGPEWCAWTYTQCVVMVGWVLFRAESFDQAAAVFTSMLGMAGANSLSFYVDPALSRVEAAVAIVAAIIGAFPVAQSYKSAFTAGPLSRLAPFLRVAESVAIVMLFVWLECLAVMSQHNPFIYFRF